MTENDLQIFFLTVLLINRKLVTKITVINVFSFTFRFKTDILFVIFRQGKDKRVKKKKKRTQQQHV